MSKFGIHLKGDWRKLNALARQLSALPEELEDVLYEEAKKVAEFIKEGLPAEVFPLSPPHSEKTIQRWGEHPLLYLTGDFARSIDVFVVSKQSGRKEFFIGTEEYAELAELLEYGGGHVPGRFLFTTVADLIDDELLSKMNAVVTHTFL